MWGDDVAIEPAATWFSCVEAALPASELGCVAPRDAADPSLATFPIVTRCHFQVFDWLVPTVFVNQDADPYLYEVYRRVGRAQILGDYRVINERGGPGSCSTATSPPRYDRVTIPVWKDRFLEPNARTLALHARPVVTLDVVIPTFRLPVDHSAEIKFEFLSSAT